MQHEDVDIKNGLVDTAGEGEGGQIEKVALTYIHYRVKQITSRKLLYNTEHPAWGSVTP